jgi:hypothetical protein
MNAIRAQLRRGKCQRHVKLRLLHELQDRLYHPDDGEFLGVDFDLFADDLRVGPEAALP